LYGIVKKQIKILFLQTEGFLSENTDVWYKYSWYISLACCVYNFGRADVSPVLATRARVASDSKKKNIWFMPKMLSQFYDRTPNEYRVDTITLDHCNGFCNVYRNPSDIAILFSSHFQFSYRSCATTRTLPLRIRHWMYREGSIFNEANTTVETETLAIVKWQSREARDECVGCSWRGAVRWNQLLVFYLCT